MSSSKAKPPTYDEVIAELLRTSTGPVPAVALTKRMLAARPSSANSPAQAMRQRLSEAAGRLLVFVDPDTVLPLRLAYRGARFRLPLDRDSMKRGPVSIGDSLYRYLPWDFPPERLRFVDTAGQPITFRVRRISEKMKTPFGRTDAEIWFADLDQALRVAFNHNVLDHLGGFWKLVPRGAAKRTRFREVELGDVNPFGGGDGAGADAHGAAGDGGHLTGEFHGRAGRRADQATTNWLPKIWRKLTSLICGLSNPIILRFLLTA